MKGPFTPLEQVMLSHGAGAENPTRLFGTYNTVATLARLARSADRTKIRAATLALGAPFVIAGTLKSVYDLGLYRLFRRIPIDES